MKEYNFDKIWEELDRLQVSKLITKKIFLKIVRANHRENMDIRKKR
jgi:hypothetical protein